MRSWIAPTTDAGTACVLARVVECIGEPDFAHAALVQLNSVLSAGSWSVYRIGGSAPPTMYLSASHGIADTTADCWRAYLSGPCVTDTTLLPAADADAVICHVTADEIPSAVHRERVYRRYGMVDRLSVVRRGHGGSVLAVNLYRHRHQGHFPDLELARFEQLAPVLIAAVQRHVGLHCPPAAGALCLQAARIALSSHCPGLTARELDVCARLLLGWSYDGIAVDLGLGVPSAKTYRNRAFRRLGICSRNELFRIFAGLSGPGRPAAVSSSGMTAAGARAR